MRRGRCCCPPAGFTCGGDTIRAETLTIYVRFNGADVATLTAPRVPGTSRFESNCIPNPAGGPNQIRVVVECRASGLRPMQFTIDFYKLGGACGNPADKTGGTPSGPVGDPASLYTADPFLLTSAWDAGVFWGLKAVEA